MRRDLLISIPVYRVIPGAVNWTYECDISQTQTTLCPDDGDAEISAPSSECLRLNACAGENNSRCLIKRTSIRWTELSLLEN